MRALISLLVKVACQSEPVFWTLHDEKLGYVAVCIENVMTLRLHSLLNLAYNAGFPPVLSS